MKISLLLGGGGSSFFGSLLKGGLGLNARVKVEFSGVVADALDGTSLSEVFDHSTSDGATHLVLVAESAAGDAEDLGDFRSHLSPSLLVKEHFVVKIHVLGDSTE